MSEPGSAQTWQTERTRVLCLLGVEGSEQMAPGVIGELPSTLLAEHAWNGCAIAGESPLGERFVPRVWTPEYGGTREILLESGVTTLQG